MQKLEKLVFCPQQHESKGKEYPNKRQWDYDPINLDYIFEDDDPLDEWLVEREDAVLPNTSFLDEPMVDIDESDREEGRGSPPQPHLHRYAILQ